ncbi:hypothetical protein VTN96DRAFT_2573 [Rasamsonia emersonii]
MNNFMAADSGSEGSGTSNSRSLTEMEDQQLGQKDAVLKTPERSAPNIRRKRIQASSLARKDGSPGHSVQMKRIFEESHEKLQAQHCIAFSSCSAQPTKSHVRPWNPIRTNPPSEDVGITTCDLVDTNSILAQACSLSPALRSSPALRTSSVDVGVSSAASVTMKTDRSHAKEASCGTEDFPVDKRNLRGQLKSHGSSGSQAQDSSLQADTATLGNPWLLNIDTWLDTVAKEAIQGECRNTATIGSDQTLALSDLDICLSRFQGHSPNGSRSASSDSSNKENHSPEVGSLKKVLLWNPRESISFSRSDSLASNASEPSDTFYNAYPRVPQPSPTTPVLACEKRPWHSVVAGSASQSIPSLRQSQLRSSLGRAEVESLSYASSTSYRDILSAQQVDIGDDGKDNPQSSAEDCPDSVENEVAALSPHVTPYRKGKAPKRPRRPSYYDSDILFKKGSQEEDVSA